jgi:serine/threonine-protein kinase
MGRARGAAPVAVALGAAALLVGFLGFSDTLNPVDALLGRGAVVAVPDLAGRPQPGAEAELRALGLDPEVRTSFSLTVPRGTVIGQDPAAGSRVREGSVVEIVVSRGVNRVEMPDAVGRPEAEVVDPLREADVDVTVERSASETVAEGLVISQDPGPGVVLSGEDEATLVVSDGPEPRPVPEVTGRSLAGASYTLGVAGLAVGRVEQVESSGVPEGAVISVEPPVGTVVERDTPMVLRVSAGPAPVPVPQVVGTDAAAARAALSGAGFVPNVVSGNGGGMSGPVTSQTPVAGTPLAPGQAVTAVVAGA